MNRQCIVPPLDGLFISGFRPNGLAGSGALTKLTVRARAVDAGVRADADAGIRIRPNAGINKRIRRQFPTRKLQAPA